MYVLIVERANIIAYVGSFQIFLGKILVLFTLRKKFYSQLPLFGMLKLKKIHSPIPNIPIKGHKQIENACGKACCSENLTNIADYLINFYPRTEFMGFVENRGGQCLCLLKSFEFLQKVCLKQSV